MTRDTSSSPVVQAAWRMSSLGYHVVPIRNKAKFPEDSNFLHFRIKPDELTTYFTPNREWNVGVIMGTEVSPGRFMVGIDIDEEDDVLIQRVRTAIDGEPVTKKGRKGLTYLVCAPHEIKSKKFRRQDRITKKNYTAIDFMGVGNQTVVPPSIHPDTGQPYQWISERSLENCPPTDLPLIDEWTVVEIQTAVNKPDSPWFLINDMSWHGPGGGGTVDDSLMRATAAMLEAGCPDDFIYNRCRRAVDACLATHGRNDWDDAVYDKRIRNLVESGRQKGFDATAPNAPGSKKIPPALIRARWLAGALGGRDLLRRNPGLLLRYSDGCWTPQRPEPLEIRLIDEFNIAHKEMREAFLTLRDMIEPWPDVRIPRVRLQNGTFDLMTGHFSEQGMPEDYILHRLPFHYDADAECPIYDRFIQRAFKQAVRDDDPRSDEERVDDQRLSVQNFEEFVGLTLVPDLSFQTAMAVVGETRTGKSTLLNLISMLHSPDAISASTIDTFNDERARTAMVGKLINISSEVDHMSAMADRMFKAVTGGDKVPVRALYQEQTYAVITARIIITGNENFRYSDDSGAIERRLLYLHCGESLRKEEQDVGLPDKLKAELPGIFNRMAAGYLRLKARGGFEKPRIHTIKVQELSEENNQVYQFLIDQTHEGLHLKHPDYVVPNGVEPAVEALQVYMRYAEWAKASGHKPMSNVTFGTRLTRAGFPSTVRRIGGRPVRVRALTFLNPHGGY